MAILTDDELKARLQAKFGETEDEDDLMLIGDITDTVKDLRSKDDGYKEKYENMKKKYRDRFFNTSSDNGNDDEDEEIIVPKSRRFEDLFKK